jgi:hypothetical protein
MTGDTCRRQSVTIASDESRAIEHGDVTDGARDLRQPDN